MNGQVCGLQRMTLAAVSVALLSASAALFAAVPVGQIASAGGRIDGIPVPAGTTLLSPAHVAAGEAPAIVHLRNGQTLAMEPGASALVRDSGGGVAVEVQSGRLAVRGGSGEVMALASNSLLMLDDEGEIQEGTRVDELVKLCQLEDSTPEKFQRCTVDDPKAEDCDWNLLEVPPAEVEGHLGVDCVYAGRENNDLGLDMDCKREIIAAVPGLGGAANWGIVAGAFVGLPIILEELDPDDTPVVSPIRP